MSFGDKIRPWEPGGEVLEVLFGHGGVSVGVMSQPATAVTEEGFEQELLTLTPGIVAGQEDPCA